LPINPANLWMAAHKNALGSVFGQHTSPTDMAQSNSRETNTAS
jgi:hypothetical protein